MFLARQSIDISAEPRAEIVETADTNDLSALKQEQTSLRRKFVQCGMMLRLSVNHKETRAYFQQVRVKADFFSAE